ncbi:MAG: hypothetical protein ACOYYI_12530 [Chloroflexota bacterium]
MKIHPLRILLALSVVLTIFFLAGGETVWAVQGGGQSVSASLNRSGFAPAPGKPGPGSVKPPPPFLAICKDGLYSIGGVVALEIKDLKPGYCVEAILWNPRFQIRRIPEDAGKPLAHLLFLRVYYAGRLTYEILPGEGTVEACYALPPEKQGQFYFFDFYGMRFKKLTRPPLTWDPIETRTDTEKKTACAFTQVSGVYALVGK